MRKTRLAAIAAASLALVAGAAPAMAGTGCNGVVDWFKWGCAGWDNNNGPKFPYFKKKMQSVPAGTQVIDKNGVWMAQINGQWAPIVAQGGGNIVAQGGGNIVAQGGGNFWVQQ